MERSDNLGDGMPGGGTGGGDLGATGAGGSAGGGSPAGDAATGGSGYGALSSSGGTTGAGSSTGGTAGGSGYDALGTTGSTGAGSSLGGTGSTSGGATADDFDEWDTSYYRRHYEAYPSRPATSTYDEARTGYALGHRAASNPSYAGQSFDVVEVELRREHGGEEQGGKFEAVREFARHAFEWKTLLGGLAVAAGAAGAWFGGRKLAEVVRGMGEEEEQDCRTYYEAHPARASVPYDRARSGYVIGFVAGRNPDYAGRRYEEVVTELQSGLTGDYGAYGSLSDFARRGYERGSRSAGTTGTTGSTGTTGTSGTTL